uniref:hypothetical protein n=1 Tax=Novosphingobium sp. (strain KA1) TaxID=164608 RepID=UPI00159EC9AA|nr:hypothetical protein [Novosphingobium sp. KA1]
MNCLQAEGLAEKGPYYLEMFRTFGADKRAALEGGEFVRTGITYRGRKTIDLGGRR